MDRIDELEERVRNLEHINALLNAQNEVIWKAWTDERDCYLALYRFLQSVIASR